MEQTHATTGWMNHETFVDVFNQAAVQNLIATIALVIGAIALRHVIAKALRSNDKLTPEIRRRWLVQTRNALLVAFLIALVVIWASEIRTVALSVVAIAAAIVIATKELILCVSGSVLRGSAQSFDVGDRIEINNVRGDVIDRTMLATTLLEIGPGHQHTGRAIVIPNSMFVSLPLINESFTDQYVLHVISVPLKIEDDWRAAENLLLQAANEACAPYLDDARRIITHLGEKQSLQSPTVDPRVTIQLPDPGRINLLVRVPVPAQRKGRLEQQILRSYLDKYKQHTTNNLPQS